MESSTVMNRKNRGHPLHTFGVSMLRICYMAYQKAQDLNGPVGSITRKTKISPVIICSIQYQLLAILSLIDDQILALEYKVETVFPPSNRIFNAIDGLIEIVEVLPDKLDNVGNDMKQFGWTFLDYALVFIISWLKSLICLLSEWRGKFTKEKDIIMDNNNNTLIVDRNINNEETKRSRCDQTINVTRGTYKEALVKATREKDHDDLIATERVQMIKDDNDNDNDVQKKKKGVNKKLKQCDAPRSISKKNNENTSQNNDLILELFESGWLMKVATKTRQERSSLDVLPRSVSYT